MDGIDGTNRFASGANRYWVRRTAGALLLGGIGLLLGGIEDLLAAGGVLLGGIEELLELLLLL